MQRTVEDFCWHAFGSAAPLAREALRAPRHSGARRTSIHGETPLQYAQCCCWPVIVPGHSRPCRNVDCPGALHLGLALDAYGLLEHARSSTTMFCLPKGIPLKPFGGNGQPPVLDEGYGLLGLFSLC